ncbi:MAG: coproporphyrinogen dehydrogenase HemZ [Clostridia bacterium]|nr:coproporphyrinogen dehydrogenase HemZ [Clostridia bacterium]
MKISTNKEEYLVEFQDLAKLFGIGESEDDNLSLTHTEEGEGEIQTKFTLIKNGQAKEYEYKYSLNLSLSQLRQKSVRKRKVQNYLYQILSNELGVQLPWGSLTGVRPTKFACDLVEYGEIRESYLVPEILNRDYFVSMDRARLVGQIIKNQKGIIRNDNLIDLYVNIPICPTRCVYCSFISSELSKVCDKVETYIDCLIKEINCVKEIIRKKSYIVRNIYIGGGTPSVLTAKQLDRLLGALNFPINEFTVECGRPDTITAEKLDVLKKQGVTRISINPQTFCEATLKRIGRKQKNMQVYEAYTLALERDFVVNMDIIAGLPGEKLGIFKRTVNTLLELQPHNITIHTLSIKNGSNLSTDGTKVDDKDVEKMLDYAHSTLFKNDYKPYYIYRQKNQLKGLENVGYFRDNYPCMFNIESMEETNTIIGIGAGAISKRVFNLERKLTRLANVKFVEDYIARFDEMLEKKKEFFK